MDQAWVTGAFVALTILHVLVLVAAVRIRRDGASRARDAATGDVECPDCGTRNEPDYRFCRRCVARLPGGRPGGDGSSSPGGRRTV